MYISGGNWLDFHKQSSSAWQNCTIGSWDAILKISARGRWDEGVISAVTSLGV